jgi:hypothetical protein
MLHEIVPFLPTGESKQADVARSGWEYYPERLTARPAAKSERTSEQPSEMRILLGRDRTGEKVPFTEDTERADETSNHGRSLFQESFFFCTVKNVADIPGAGRIYVEAVVEKDSGIAFAKVYSSKNPWNAVNILTSRVVPFFARQGAYLQDVRTRKTSEYCGLPTLHPFEFFLANAHIQHLHVDHPGRPSSFLCERFYSFLLKEFFLPSLRTKFNLTLDELQKNLDAFVQDYNSTRMKRVRRAQATNFPAENFPVDL